MEFIQVFPLLGLAAYIVLGTNGHQWDLQGGFQKNPQGHYCRSLKG